MTDYIELGSSPIDENCAQVGQPDYYDKSVKECRAYANQLRRMFGPEPEGTEIRTKSFPHDFGSYREVVCVYEEENPKAVTFALKLEHNLPANWDKLAKEELGL